MPACCRRRGGVDDLADARALVHGVEDLLTAALGAQPDFDAAGAGEAVDGDGCHQVGRAIEW